MEEAEEATATAARRLLSRRREGDTWCTLGRVIPQGMRREDGGTDRKARSSAKRGEGGGEKGRRGKRVGRSPRGVNPCGRAYRILRLRQNETMFAVKEYASSPLSFSLSFLFLLANAKFVLGIPILPAISQRRIDSFPTTRERRGLSPIILDPWKSRDANEHFQFGNNITQLEDIRTFLRVVVECRTPNLTDRQKLSRVGFISKA